MFWEGNHLGAWHCARDKLLIIQPKGKKNEKTFNIVKTATSNRGTMACHRQCDFAAGKKSAKKLKQ